MLLEITAPELHMASCSRTYDRMPSVMCQGFQSLAWVRGGLWLHVTLSAAAGHMSNSDVNTMAYLISSGAFLCIFVKLHVPHLNLSSLCFHVVGSDTGVYLWEVMVCHTSHVLFQKFPQSHPFSKRRKSIFCFQEWSQSGAGTLILLPVTTSRMNK